MAPMIAQRIVICVTPRLLTSPEVIVCATALIWVAPIVFRTPARTIAVRLLHHGTHWYSQRLTLVGQCIKLRSTAPWKNILKS
ncbi:MAG: hypothetical protein NTX49_10550 [Chlamydiae bacterium]|nr:hypothetical protein [Chlamydiota bacterium]